MAGFGIPISIGVGIYTGVLSGALTARPFWNNPMLPILFLISATISSWGVTLLFWTVVVRVGILLPLALEVCELIPHYIWQVELREHNPWISGIITTSVLIGGFAMRYIVIYAGQIAQIITS